MSGDGNVELFGFKYIVARVSDHGMNTKFGARGAMLKDMRLGREELLTNGSLSTMVFGL